MPAIRHSFSKRTDVGATFSAVFGALAATVLVICAVWGFLIPRKRTKQGRRSSRHLSLDGTSIDYTPRARLRKFPPHPAVKPLLSKPVASQIPSIYNPRTESPFPIDQLARPLATFDPRVSSAPATPSNLSSNGLFTPQRQGTMRGAAKSQFHTVPRASDAKDFAEPSHDFGDAKDFILAIPEPLVLRPKDSAKFIPTKDCNESKEPRNVSPSASDRLLHPNKLFKAVESGDVRGSLYSTSSIRLDHRASDLAMTVEEVTAAVDDAITEGVDKDHSRHAKIEAQSDDPDKAVMHRLRSYHSLTGRPSKVVRAGTVTRPKTPVDGLRTFYDQNSSKESMPMICLSRELSQSTAITHTDTLSEDEKLSTPASSPTLAASTLHLLPTPLKPSRSFAIHDHSSKSSWNILQGTESQETQNSATDVDDGDTCPAIVASTPKGMIRGKKPAPLQLNSILSPVQDCESRRSMTDFSTAIVAPMFRAGQLKSRVRASSMYSRDTQGHSLATTPTTPNLPSPMVDIFADHGSFGNPFKGRDSVKDRISEWTQRIDGQSVPTLCTKRSISQSREPLLPSTAERNESPSDIEQSNDAKSMEIAKAEAGQDKVAPGGALWV